MTDTATASGIKKASIVLGLYIAALLLAGPFHPLMHQSGSLAFASECDSDQAAFTFHEVHTFDYSPHSCPACFLHSHQAVGDNLSLADVKANFQSSDIAKVESEVVTHVSHSPISNRAPPLSL